MNKLHEGRIRKLIDDMEKDQLDLMIVYSDVWRPGNVVFLTDWRQGGGGVGQAWTILFLSPKKQPVLVVGFEHVETASQLAKGVSRIEPSNKLDKILKEIYEDVRPRNIGLIGEDLIPYNIYTQLAVGLKGDKFSNQAALLTAQRRIKTADDIAGIRKSFELTDAALLETIKAVREGISEVELYAIGTSAIHSRQGYLGFYPTIGTGPNSAHAMQIPGDRKVQRGDLIMIDYGTYFGGYYSDATRNVGFGLTDKRKIAMLETGMLAFDEAIKVAKPGAEMAEVEMTVRRVIAENGFGEYIVHNVGHGIGVDHEEDFPIGPDCHIILEPGMTFTIEPGIYIPGFGGCRHEDMVVITETGCEVFSKVKRDWFID